MRLDTDCELLCSSCCVSIHQAQEDSLNIHCMLLFACLLFINVPLDAVVAPQEEDTSAWRSSGDTEVYVEPTHPKEMLEGLNRLRLNRALCDVVLCCGGQEFPCHRYVLASFSPYFEVIV